MEHNIIDTNAGKQLS